MSGWTKLFSSIVTSSIWVADDPTLRVWIAMLATADADGLVEGSIPGFANLACVTVEQMRAAIVTLTSPDPDSRTPDYEGRRIEPVAGGGWRILNYRKYRERGQDRAGSRARYFRERRAQQKDVAHNTVQHADVARYTEAEAEAEAEAEDRRTHADARASASCASFDEFWAAYPRKHAKPAAERAWTKLAPSADLISTILAAINRQKASRRWREDAGRYIPNPATWLHQRRWEDEDEVLPAITRPGLTGPATPGKYDHLSRTDDDE